MYDLLIKNGRVIDPAQNLDGKLDVAISGDKIAKVARDIPSGESQEVFDAKDRIVTPGLIDIHSHVYDSVSWFSVEPDDAGVKQGVTTVVDGGSAGQIIFKGLTKYIIPAFRTTVLCFLHLASMGQSILPEFRLWEDIDVDATTATIESNRDVIRGIKLRMVGDLVVSDGVKIVKIAKDITKKFGMPIMVHIGHADKRISPTLTQELLTMMDPGDILSHVFTAEMGGVTRPDGTIMPELKEAKQRGVVLDLGHGRANFSFDVARKAIAQGILPTTLSNDLTIPSLTDLIYGMTVTMSKLMALGLSLNQVVEMTTINPARAINTEDRRGSLKPGMDADISIMELLSGTWKLEDTARKAIEVNTLIAPTMTVKLGQLIPAQPVGRPKPLNT